MAIYHLETKVSRYSSRNMRQPSGQTGEHSGTLWRKMKKPRIAG